MFQENQSISSLYVSEQNLDIACFYSYLNSIYNRQIIDNDKFTKLYLSDNELSNRIIYEVANYLYPRFYNEELFNSLNMSDEYKYKKIIDISNNLLFVKNSNYYNVLNNLIHSSLYYYSKNKYDACINFFKNLGYSSYFSDQVLNFTLNNENIYAIERKKSKYLTHNEEYNCLKSIVNNKITNDYINFLKIPGTTNQYYPDTNDMRDLYINKKTGNVGEYLTSEYLKSKNRNFLFASKDVCDGLGFDFIVDGDWGFKEILLEAKASLTPNNPNFYITDNEYEVMLRNINSRNTLYLVAKLFVSLDPNQVSTIDVLEPLNETTFQSIYPSKTQYMLNEEIKYNKKKTFTLVR